MDDMDGAMDKESLHPRTASLKTLCARWLILGSSPSMTAKGCSGDELDRWIYSIGSRTRGFPATGRDRRISSNNNNIGAVVKIIIL
jgi:hypothetical protein